MNRDQLRTTGTILPAFCLALVINAFARHEHHTKGLHEPPRLNPGFGQINHPVSTENAEAQKFFNQGLALIYGFNHNEARRAAKLDPNLAMAYWGKDTPGETPFGLNSAASVFK